MAIFNLIVDMRHWNAMYDGVYLKTEKLEPNPYLNPNYIKSENNETLVWVNPAFMTRQISDIASLRDGFKLKITSNKLINQHNAPDEDEKKALDFFETNRDTEYLWEIKDGEFKFMGALKTEADCLKCHAHQGYKVGDIRGGISVMFDVNKEFEQLKEINKDKTQTIIFLIVAAIGAVITLLIHYRIKRRDEMKISSLNHSLQMKVQELDMFNKTLHEKVQEEIKKQREKENLLIQQSKMAALGEMIGNIAHQWRQPISSVSAIMMNIKWTAISQGVDSKFLDERMKEANEQLKYMSNTIDDFRNFFKPNKEKESFDVVLEVKKACNIIKDSLDSHNITLNLEYEDEAIFYGYPSEFSQVILSILSNAKYVLIERKVDKPKIRISIKKENSQIVCEICDNGGGIESKYVDKIFEPYFTTKELRGTGIGLYISKEIIEKHMNGELSVKNSKDGASFIIKLKS